MRFTTTYCLFGGVHPWDPSDWTASDDRVRGGSSQSFFDFSSSSPQTAIFYGNLDTTTLGGAGFASQRTTTNTATWDLSNYDGILIDIAHQPDDKTYTFILKDEILPKGDDGREQSTVSWEFDFGREKVLDGKVFIAWEEFKATYRGRPKNGTEPLNLKGIRRFSLMMRSFFNTQSGPFSLSITSISAAKGPPRMSSSHGSSSSTAILEEEEKGEKRSIHRPISHRQQQSQGTQQSSWSTWLCGCFY